MVFFSGVVDLDESLGARDQVDVEFMEVRERFIEERQFKTFSDMEGVLLRLFSEVNRSGGARKGRCGGVGELEPERLAVRCLEANVEPHIETLSGPDTDREEAVDKRLVERPCGSLDPDMDRCVTG